MSSVITIKGNIVLPTEILFDSYLTMSDGKITDISKETTSANVIDATNQYILPGAIDAHVHCYSSLAEGFTNATRSAAAGGVTTIIEMPYDADKLICTQELFDNKIGLLEQEAVVDVAMLATIAPQGGLDQIPLLAQSGACGFKVSLFNTDSTRFPKIDEGELFEAFQEIEKTGRPVGVHAETDSIVRKFIEKHAEEGENDPAAHCKSRPKVAESTAALTVMELAHYTNVKLHLYHCTFPRVFDLVAYYKEQGTNVTAETCTHYLTLCENDMNRLKAKAKINPPLRSESDMDILWELLALNQIDMVTSDHAPWTIDKKQADNIFENSSGAPGVEVLLPILFSEGVATGKISLLQLVKVLSENPANRFGLGHRKGKIEVGYDADIVILNPEEKWVLDESQMHSTAGWSPYNGMEMHGKVKRTFVRGKEVFNGKITGNPGDGTFISAVHTREV
ncbi:amidohydrolase family protein [Bacillus aerolatus]|uniref:Amidohydrolase family protein n=1 Tax=Bacillus aerolatus TaxID=2653354 RepID=A0A6I1FLK6_9BACI|nr:dihydroorotase family protein [Bacillus aerolatus]KAB7707167.1 amidohydrolase family protein [Bacillus aerolatus]